MVRVGVIGLGAFGEFQIQALRGIPGAEVVAVASRNAKRAGEIAARYGVPAAHTAATDLCADPNVEAVLVATEEARHVEPALAAIVQGKPVLVEKPLATSVADALTIARAGQEYGSLVMPGHIVRFEPRFGALQRRLAAGDLGRVAAIHASRNRPRATLGTYGRCHPALVTAIHDIDAALWMLGERPVAVSGSQRLEEGPDGVYGVWGTFRFRSGARLTVEATWMMPDDSGLECADHFAVTATSGVAAIDMGAPGLRMLTPGRHEVPEMGYQPWGQDAIGGALQAELMHFLLLVDGRTGPVVQALDGVVAVVAATALIEAAETGRDVAIDWTAVDDLM
jgi:UDP-N-acetylglucosamine 3-dehydrogenase